MSIFSEINSSVLTAISSLYRPSSELLFTSSSTSNFVSNQVETTVPEQSVKETRKSIMSTKFKQKRTNRKVLEEQGHATSQPSVVDVCNKTNVAVAANVKRSRAKIKPEEAKGTNEVKKKSSLSILHAALRNERVKPVVTNELVIKDYSLKGDILSPYLDSILGSNISPGILHDFFLNEIVDCNTNNPAHEEKLEELDLDDLEAYIASSLSPSPSPSPTYELSGNVDGHITEHNMAPNSNLSCVVSEKFKRKNAVDSDNVKVKLSSKKPKSSTKFTDSSAKKLNNVILGNFERLPEHTKTAQDDTKNSLVNIHPIKVSSTKPKSSSRSVNISAESLNTGTFKNLKNLSAPNTSLITIPAKNSEFNIKTESLSLNKSNTNTRNHVLGQECDKTDAVLKCEECEETEAVVKCQECEELFCSSCDSLIHAKAARILHNRLPLALKIICEECETDNAICRCIECEQLLCKTCDTTLHAKAARSRHIREPLNSVIPTPVPILQSFETAKDKSVAPVSKPTSIGNKKRKASKSEICFKETFQSGNSSTATIPSDVSYQSAPKRRETIFIGSNSTAPPPGPPSAKVMIPKLVPVCIKKIVSQKQEMYYRNSLEKNSNLAAAPSEPTSCCIINKLSDTDLIRAEIEAERSNIVFPHDLVSTVRQTDSNLSENQFFLQEKSNFQDSLKKPTNDFGNFHLQSTLSQTKPEILTSLIPNVQDVISIDYFSKEQDLSNQDTPQFEELNSLVSDNISNVKESTRVENTKPNDFLNTREQISSEQELFGKKEYDRKSFLSVNISNELVATEIEKTTQKLLTEDISSENNAIYKENLGEIHLEPHFGELLPSDSPQKRINLSDNHLNPKDKKSSTVKNKPNYGTSKKSPVIYLLNSKFQSEKVEKLFPSLNVSRVSKPCKFYFTGNCQEGSLCKFSHAGIPDRKFELCRFIFSVGGCKKGDTCPYGHIQNNVPCMSFQFQNFCKDGTSCAYSHRILDVTEKSRYLEYITKRCQQEPEFGKNADISVRYGLQQQMLHQAFDSNFLSQFKLLLANNISINGYH